MLDKSRVRAASTQHSRRRLHPSSVHLKPQGWPNVPAFAFVDASWYYGTDPERDGTQKPASSSRILLAARLLRARAAKTRRRGGVGLRGAGRGRGRLRRSDDLCGLQTALVPAHAETDPPSLLVLRCPCISEHPQHRVEASQFVVFLAYVCKHEHSSGRRGVEPGPGNVLQRREGTSGPSDGPERAETCRRSPPAWNCENAGVLRCVLAREARICRTRFGLVG